MSASHQEGGSSASPAYVPAALAARMGQAALSVSWLCPRQRQAIEDVQHGMDLIHRQATPSDVCNALAVLR